MAEQLRSEQPRTLPLTLTEWLIRHRHRLGGAI
jgi:hypothetical protein